MQGYHSERLAELEQLCPHRADEPMRHVLIHEEDARRIPEIGVADVFIEKVQTCTRRRARGAQGLQCADGHGVPLSGELDADARAKPTCHVREHCERAAARAQVVEDIISCELKSVEHLTPSFVWHLAVVYGLL